VRVAPIASDLPRAAFRVAKDTGLVVSTPKGRQLCAQAQVVRSGVSSDWSQPKCEKAG
jgi:hypothetical protein